MPSPLLSIIISNRNDIAMLAVTVRSCIEEMRPLGPNAAEIVIADNSDEAAYNLVLSAIPVGYIREKKIKIYRQPDPCLFSARELAAKKSSGEYLLCLDSHMLVGRDCFSDLLNFMESRRSYQSLGFAHAPISWAHQHERVARHDRDMSVHELGDWGTKYSKPRKITWKGMPWICRRSFFLNDLKGYGALSKHKISWGGGDMHIGIKPWLLGFENWAVPTNPCIHIGPFPKLDTGDDPNVVSATKDFQRRDRYRLYAKSGNYPHTFGFLVSCYVLGGEPMMLRNKEALIQRFGRFIDVEKYWQKAIEIGTEEREWLLKNQKISFEELIKAKPWNL